MTRRCASPIPLATLAEYWLGELDATREAELDEHLLGCGHCSAELQRLADLGDGIRALVGTGTVRAVVTDAFVKRLAATGRTLREYRVAPNGSVNCTLAPSDDVLVARLQAPLAGLERLDLELPGAEGGERVRLADIPFDPTAGEVIFAPDIPSIRALPAIRYSVRLLAVAREGERVVGEYTFNHTPWPGAQAGE
jgi:hypothetical protein